MSDPLPPVVASTKKETIGDKSKKVLTGLVIIAITVILAIQLIMIILSSVGDGIISTSSMAVNGAVYGTQANIALSLFLGQWIGVGVKIFIIIAGALLLALAIRKTVKYINEP